VKTWDYWLQSYKLDRLASSQADMLVIDYARFNPDGGAMIPFTRAEVEQLQRTPDGRRRLVVAYFSIGEAEEYRPYWQSRWTATPPGWLIGENCRWPRNHLVQFWSPEWRKIIFDGADSYLARIKAAGFDGVYLDRVDAYDDLKTRFPQARQQIIEFVQALSARAKAGTGNFIVIAQNAEELLSDTSYRAAIDAVAKEDLLHGVGGTGRRNTADLIAWSKAQLAKLQREDKPVLAIEYLVDLAAVDTTRRELSALGIVSVFPPRALDGSDPFSTEAVTKLPAEIGTPEYGEQRCDGVFKKK
jgi:cysteinyl-tRNA synthetase